jgi:hypothetical protein
MKRTLLFTIYICLFFSCGKNALKQFQSGDTLGSYKTLYKKAKKDKLERDEKNLFKKVISELITEDSITYYRLIDYKTFESDKKAYILFVDMDKRREEIDRLNIALPNYGFLNYDDYDQLSKNITETMYVEADNLLNLSSQSGNRLDAQEAFKILEDMKFFHTATEYDLLGMQDIALELGVEHILINFVNRSYNNNYLVDKYSDFDDLDLYNNQWKVYHDRQGFEQYVYIIDIVIRQARFYENENTTTENYNKDIVTGYETQTDTSGNTVRKEIIEKIYATVRKSEVTRVLTIDSELEFRVINGSRFDEDLARSYQESTVNYTYTGYIRAIPENVKNDLNSNASFSSDDDFFRILMPDFLEEAGDIIKDVRL